MALSEDDYDYDDEITRLAQDVSAPILSSSALAQAGAIGGFFIAAVFGVLCGVIAFFSGIRAFWLIALLSLPLGIFLGWIIGGAINQARTARRRRKRMEKESKRKARKVRREFGGK